MTGSNVTKFRPKAKGAAKKESGKGGGERREEPPPHDFSEPCPVRALGYDNATMFYTTPSGDVRALLTGRHGNAAELEALFMGDLGWARSAFPGEDNRGKPNGDYDAKKLRQFLLRACNEAGPIDIGDSVRGPGVWPGANADELVLHLGDRLGIVDLRTGAVFEEEVGKREADGHLYPLTAPVPRPAIADGHLKPAPASEGAALMEFLGHWPFRAPKLAERLYLGWLFSAPMAGTWRHRPHMLVTGDLGRGKTLLVEMSAGILGGERSAVLKLAAASAPFVRNALKGATKPVFIDEAEQKAEGRQTEDIYDLAKLASTDSQGETGRAGTRGEAFRWPVRAPFHLGAIVPPRMDPEIASRFTVLALDPLDADPDKADAVREGVQAWIGLGAALRARAILGRPRFVLNFQTYARALSPKGMTTRQIDQLGTLLAWADVALSDAVVTAEHAERIVAQLEPAEIVRPRSEDSAAMRCWAKLLTYSDAVETVNGGRVRKTIGQMLAERLKAASANIDDALRTYAIRIVREEVLGGTTPAHLDWIVIGHESSQLDKVFAQSRWKNGAWVTSLHEMPGAKSGPTLRLGGVSQRGIWIPGHHVSEDEDGNSGT